MQELQYHDLNHVYVLHVDKYIDKYIHLDDTFVSSLNVNKYQQHLEHEFYVNFDLDIHYYLLAFLRRQHCPRGQR